MAVTEGLARLLAASAPCFIYNARVHVRSLLRMACCRTLLSGSNPTTI